MLSIETSHMTAFEHIKNCPNLAITDKFLSMIYTQRKSELEKNSVERVQRERIDYNVQNPKTKKAKITNQTLQARIKQEQNGKVLCIAKAYKKLKKKP